MFDDLHSWVKVAAALAGVFTVLRLARQSKEARAEHPPLNYFAESLPNTDSWRWRIPSAQLGLDLNDTATASILKLPVSYSPREFGCAVGALLFAVATLVLVAMLPFSTSTGMVVFLLLCSAALSAALVSSCVRLVAIERLPGDAVLVVAYCLVLKRRYLVPASLVKEISGHEQSLGRAEIGQARRYYQIEICQGGYLFRHTLSFTTGCNLSQGTWIVGGLNNWCGVLREPPVVDEDAIATTTREVVDLPSMPMSSPDNPLPAPTA